MSFVTFQPYGRCHRSARVRVCRINRPIRQRLRIEKEQEENVATHLAGEVLLLAENALVAVEALAEFLEKDRHARLVGLLAIPPVNTAYK